MMKLFYFQDFFDIIFDLIKYNIFVERGKQFYILEYYCIVMLNKNDILYGLVVVFYFFFLFFQRDWDIYWDLRFFKS